MANGITINFSRAAAVAALLAIATPACAADPIFPLGSRVGLVPPSGMATSKTFQGFEDIAKDSAILVAAQSAAAYPEIEKTLATDVLKKQGITVDKRESIQLGFGAGILITGKQEADNKLYRKWLLVAPANDLTALANGQIPDQESAYPDAVMRAALMTLAVRATVPDEELLSLLPFTIGDMAGFHVENVLPGRALMLADTAKDGSPSSPHARLFIAAASGGPAEAQDRAEFARLAFGEIAGIKNIHVTMSEPLRLAGQAGFQTMAQAKDANNDSDIMVVQWLRFGSGGFLQIIGMAPADGWPALLSRLRTVRDSIDPR